MSTTPSPSLAERLQAHHEAGYLSLHMPGHKENTALAPYLACLRADLDITELPDFDDLHDPSGVLAQAMDRAAALWDSRRSYLQVNGSTGGLLAAIRAATRRGDKVLVARHCHKAVYHAIELCGLEPVFLVPPVEPTFGIAASLPPEQVAAALEAHPDAALVCTAPLAHAAVIGELLDHDLPVFTELNLVSDGYRENMAKAAAKNLPLFLSSTMLYRRETQYIKQQVAEFGKPVHYIYHIGQYLPDWHPWENYKNFFVGNARTGGVREIFGIDLPWLLDAFGDVESVTVQKDTISDLGLPYPDCVTLLLRHKGGVQGVLAADVVSRKAVRSFECFGDGIHLFWEGNPKALYEFKDGDKRFVNTYASFEHDSRYSDNVVENAYVDELTNFFGVLKGDEQPKWSFEKDLKAIELMDRIEKA